MGLPPNSAANTSFLQQLRSLLVQDWDLDDDGRADTLRLLFATPRHWLRDGAWIKVERAPTAFGGVAFHVKSHVTSGSIIAVANLRARRAPARVLLRLRLPGGFRIKKVRVDGHAARLLDHETLDLSGVSGRVQVEAEVAGE